MSVFYAISVLLITGALGGILLAAASHYLSIQDDGKQTRLRNILPGINCGACGYSGCDAYAAALAVSSAPPTLCIPGGASVAAALSCELGLDACALAELMPAVHCRGKEGCALRIAEYDGNPSCAQAVLASGGHLACKYACLGRGDCAAACPVDAIFISEGIARIKRDACISCGICTEVCPRNIIEMIPKGSAVFVGCRSNDTGAVARKGCKNACIACKKCERACEWDAIRVVDNLAVINYEKCVSCKACIEACPTGCIALV